MASNFFAQTSSHSQPLQPTKSDGLQPKSYDGLQPKTDGPQPRAMASNLRANFVPTWTPDTTDQVECLVACLLTTVSVLLESVWLLFWRRARNLNER